MYRGHGRGSASFAGASASNAASLESSGTSITQEQKLSGADRFVPSLNAIAANRDLQWLVQPALVQQQGASRSPAPPYPSLSGTRPGAPPPHDVRMGVIRAGAAPTRRRNEEHETEQLEDEKSRLQNEIAELQKQKEKLELVLEAHRPICKIQDSSDSDGDAGAGLSSSALVKTEPEEYAAPGPAPAKTQKVKPKISLPAKSASSSSGQESESLHTPVLASTPSLTPLAASMIFTYPSAPADVPQQAPQPCGAAHRRSSSSGDQSDHSLHSPTILTL
ncbi:fos-related antigen 1a isoform X3 [Corythoichthys intestinalis]|uniref:fos-related antigen 1a isoform X3 n=1 Tax=Corythoichthys intestinalis TaxID=161448 RepID=UPI0025A5CAA1|nr:fos-related antigen 1a isoform X3 [Corythoichthys intestinalis]